MQNQPRVQLRVAPSPNPEWTYVQYFEQRCNPGWESFFGRPEIRGELEFIEANVMRKAAGVGYLPPKELTFRIFDLIGPQSVKVVIIGQDPYPTPGDATGVAFSVWRHMKPPASLRAIYDELEASVPGFRRPEHGDLSSWITQGVMLLNSALTVNKGKGREASHGGMWTRFISEVLKEILRHNPKVLLVLWGKQAQNLLEHVGEHVKHLKAGHPSPNNFHSDFKGCGHFVKINEYLRSIGEPEIDWRL